MMQHEFVQNYFQSLKLCPGMWRSFHECIFCCRGEDQYVLGVKTLKDCLRRYNINPIYPSDCLLDRRCNKTCLYPEYKCEVKCFYKPRLQKYDYLGK